VEARGNPQHRGKSPRTETGTQSESDSVSTACLEAQRKFRGCELFASDARSTILFGPNRWPAGPPWRVALCLAQQKNQKRYCVSCDLLTLAI